MGKNSKERLFEVMSKIDPSFKPMNEQVLPVKKKEEIIDEFVNYCYGHLGMEGEPEGIDKPC